MRFALVSFSMPTVTNSQLLCNLVIDAKRLVGFLLYAIAVVAFAVFMIYRIAPQYGKQNALIYLSICSTVGSISVMSVKAFGIALKLTFAGNNQFSHPSTYVFLILTAVCILTQMNYFNKALASFPTNMSVTHIMMHPLRCFVRLHTQSTNSRFQQCQPSLLCDIYHCYALRFLHLI